MSSLGLLHGALSTIVCGQRGGVDVNTQYGDTGSVARLLLQIASIRMVHKSTRVPVFLTPR